MSHSKVLTHPAIVPTYILIALAVLLSTLLPTANAATTAGTTVFTSYNDCLTIIKKAKNSDDLSTMKNRVSTVVTNRQNSLDTLLKKNVPTLLPDHQATITEGIAQDKATLDQIAASAKTATSPYDLQALYCQAIYKTQVNPFRARQIFYLNAIDKQINRDTKLRGVLTNSNNTEANPAITNSKLGSEINSRLNAARGLMSSNLDAENAAVPQVLNASVSQSDYTNNLPVLSFTATDQKNLNFRTAYLQYTEASVLKVAAKGFNPDQTLTLKSIALSTDDTPVTLDSKSPSAGKATKAVVVIAESNVKGDYTRTVTRHDSGVAWKVTKTEH